MRRGSRLDLSYALAALTVAVAFAVVATLADLLQANPPVSLFLCAIILAAWFGGFGPALLATVLSVLGFGYFFLLPINSLMLASRDLPRIALFGIAGLLIGSVSAAQRRTTASLRQTRDQLQEAIGDLRALNGQLLRENGERKAAEQKTRAAERELQATIDMIPVLVARYQRDGSFDFVNRTWRDYTGLSLEQVKDRPRDIVIHPDDLEPFDNLWRSHCESGEPFEIEQRVLRADGQYRWHMVRRAPLRDENRNVIRWYAVAFDIHTQKEAEAALRKSEAYLDQAQRLSHTGSFGWNVASGDIVWSKETYQILGIDPAITPTTELVAQHIPPDDYVFVQAELDRSRQGKQNLDFEHRWLTPGGDVKQLHVRTQRMTYESGEEEIVGAVMDVTETRRAQEALADAQAQLTHANRVATLGEMSASIAHEVRQPLAAIVANAEASARWLTREKPEVGEALRIVAQIVTQAERASGVIQRIRTLARKSKAEMSPLDINRLIDDVIGFVRREALNHRVSLRVESALGLPAAFGDRVQIQQVIINLVVNSIQAMMSVTNRARMLTIRTQEYEDDAILVAIEDAGVGVSSDDLNRLFGAFYTTKSEGMGMGLSISRSIIDAHRGRIWAIRNSGPGMTFQFTIPRFRMIDLKGVQGG